MSGDDFCIEEYTGDEEYFENEGYHAAEDSTGNEERPGNDQRSDDEQKRENERISKIMETQSFDEVSESPPKSHKESIPSRCQTTIAASTRVFDDGTSLLRKSSEPEGHRTSLPATKVSSPLLQTAKLEARHRTYLTRALNR